MGIVLPTSSLEKDESGLVSSTLSCAGDSGRKSGASSPGDAELNQAMPRLGASSDSLLPDGEVSSILSLLSEDPDLLSGIIAAAGLLYPGQDMELYCAGQPPLPDSPLGGMLVRPDVVAGKNDEAVASPSPNMVVLPEEKLITGKMLPGPPFVLEVRGHNLSSEVTGEGATLGPDQSGQALSPVPTAKFSKVTKFEGKTVPSALGGSSEESGPSPPRLGEEMASMSSSSPEEMEDVGVGGPSSLSPVSHRRGVLLLAARKSDSLVGGEATLQSGSQGQSTSEGVWFTRRES